MHADPMVARYLGPGRPRSVEETAGWLEQILSGYERAGLGQLAVIRKTDDTLVGRCGLSHLEVESAPQSNGDERRAWFGLDSAPAGVAIEAEREMGYTFDRAAWGQGFAQEAIACVLEHLRGAPHGARITSVIHPENVRSRHLADKFGVRLIDRVRVAGIALDRYLWPDLWKPPLAWHTRCHAM